MGMYPDTFDYFGGSGVTGADVGMGALGVFLGIYLIFILLMMAFSVVSYVLHSLGLYTIAKRRGIHHAWLAWIAIGSEWILGSIADQYQYVAKGKVRSRRKALLGLELAVLGTTIASYICIAAMAVVGAMDAAPEAMVLPALLMVLFAMAMIVLSIIFMVFVYIAYYDMFASCQPENAVLYLVLGIIFPIAMPFFVFACRKQDKGMPPRKPVAPEPIQTAWQQPVAAIEPAVIPVEEPAPVIEAEVVPEEPKDE